MNKEHLKIIRNRSFPEIEIKEGAQEIYSIKKHSHKELSIGFIEDGSSTILCKDLEFNMNQGDAILIPPDIVHLCQPEDINKFRFKMVYVDADWFYKVFDSDSNLFKSDTKKTGINEQSLKENFLSSFTENMGRMKAESDAIYFLENIVFKLFKCTPKKTLQKNNSNIKIIKDFLDDNFTNELSLDDLTGIINESKYSILRKFRKEYKLTPHSYIINKRIEYSKKLLLKNISIADTAVSSGFFDQSHFIKTFRSYVGMNPSEYK